MAFWIIREELSLTSRIRRSYYELLRDELDQYILQYGLINSYENFKAKKLDYPFVEFRELKPRARIPVFEHESQNAFLIIFVEDTIPSMHKKYIRFFDTNKTTKKNLLHIDALPLVRSVNRYQKYLDSAHFTDFMEMLLPVDYALLIQRDSSCHARNRYHLSHFHVRIDWPITDAAEDLARHLRYISKDIYEKGEKYAEDIQKKYFEYYGFPQMVGGRRTAAIVAAQYLKRVPCISTIYVCSSESRALVRLSERGVTKSILVKFTPKEISQIAEANSLTKTTFKKNYVVAKENKNLICLFQAIYNFSSHAKPPVDGKLREINPDTHWLTVKAQQILPKPGVWKYPPLPMNIIYAQQTELGT